MKALNVIGLALTIAASQADASVVYDYVGNTLSDGISHVQASVTFDSSITTTFSGMVDLSNVIQWSIGSP